MATMRSRKKRAEELEKHIRTQKIIKYYADFLMNDAKNKFSLVYFDAQGYQTGSEKEIHKLVEKLTNADNKTRKAFLSMMNTINNLSKAKCEIALEQCLAREEQKL